MAVVYALSFRELRTRLGGYRLGYLWILAEPVMHVVIFSVSMGMHARQFLPGIDFPMFILIGILPYDLFSKVFGSSLGAVEANQGLYVYKQVKPLDVVLTRWLVEVGIHGAALVVLLAGMAMLGYGGILPDDPLGVVAVFALLAVFALGCGLVGATLTEVFPESRKFLPYLTRPLFFISGIFFSLSMIPEEYRPYLDWNPLLHYLDLVRSCWFSEFPHGYASWSMASAAALAALVLGLGIYARFRHRLTEHG